MPSDVKRRKKNDSKSKADSPNKNDKQKSDIKDGRKQADGDLKDPVIKIDYKRIIIRCLLIVGIIAVVRLTHKDNLETFASQNEEIPKKSLSIECSKDYVDEIDQFPGCVPQKCGRFVSDSVVSLPEIQALLLLAHKGIGLGGSGGGASILDLHSGALSKGETFVDVYAVDKEHKVITKEDLKIYSHVKEKIKASIVSHFGLNPKALYLTHPTFFSRINSRPAQTIHDEYWHPHVDKDTYQSFHYTSLLYLTDYNSHFQGGRFIFVDKDANRTVEPRVGRLSAFTSGSENLHFVEPVSSGTRFAITVSFTCDPKHDIKELKFRK